MAQIADWVLGRQLPAEVKWAYEIEHCPQIPQEDGQCIGKFVIYGYLRVTEHRENPIPIVGRIIDFVHDIFTSSDYEWKILPIKFVETFKVRTLGYADQAFTGKAFRVEDCPKWTATKNATSPQHIGDTQFEYGFPEAIVTPDVPAKEGDGIKATTQLVWQQGLVVSSGIVPGSVTIPNPVGGTPITIATAGPVQITAGPAYEAPIQWTVTWKDHVCSVDIHPDPTTDINDAKNVYRQGLIERKI